MLPCMNLRGCLVQTASLFASQSAEQAPVRSIPFYHQTLNISGPAAKAFCKKKPGTHRYETKKKHGITKPKQQLTLIKYNKNIEHARL